MTSHDFNLMKILLIDDESFIRTTIRQILVQIGIPNANIYEAESAAAGMLETLRVRPMLVFCDIHMPEEDGLKYLARLRKSPLADVAATPVVVLTSDASEGAVVTAKNLNADGYLVKPVSVAAVQRALDWALRPPEEAPAEEDGPNLVIRGEPEDLRMIAALIKELYQVQVTSNC